MIDSADLCLSEDTIMVMGGSSETGRNPNFITYNTQRNTMRNNKLISRRFARK